MLGPARFDLVSNLYRDKLYAYISGGKIITHMLYLSKSNVDILVQDMKLEKGLTTEMLLFLK